MSVYNPNTNQNVEQQNKPTQEPLTTGRAIYTVFHSMMFILAIYLSFKCNGKFEISSFLAACLCPYFYIIYIFATKGGCGILDCVPSKQ